MSGLLTHQQAIALLREITYKPGVSIEFVLEKHRSPQQLTLRVQRDVPDTHPPHEVRPIVFVNRICLDTDFNGFRTQILRALITMETHETKEWFKVRGEIFCDPHKNELSSEECL